MEKYTKSYVDIIYEYIDAMDGSDFMNEQLDRELLIFTGFKAITHIFQINFINTNDFTTTHFSCQKAYYFYLEYLEQMQKTNMSHDLNYTDAIQFLYSKTIAEYSPTNITGMSYEVLRIPKVIECLLWFNNKLQTVDKAVLLKLLRYNHDELLLYMEIAVHYPMDAEQYATFLKEMAKLFTKKTKPISYAEKIQKIDTKMTVVQFARWLITE